LFKGRYVDDIFDDAELMDEVKEVITHTSMPTLLGGRIPVQKVE